jgi:hypothetical protein
MQCRVKKKREIRRTGKEIAVSVRIATALSKQGRMIDTWRFERSRPSL